MNRLPTPVIDRSRFDLETMVVADLARRLMPADVKKRAVQRVSAELKATDTGRLLARFKSPHGTPESIHRLFDKRDWLFTAGDVELHPVESLNVDAELSQKTGIPTGWLVVFDDDPIVFRVRQRGPVMVEATQRQVT